MFETLSPAVPDALMQVMRAYREDPRPAKLDLGIGTFRDDAGRTPVLHAVKEAEQILWATQGSKAYLSPQGDMMFVELLGDVVFGSYSMGNAAIRGVQTPGGTGAVRLGMELLRLCNPAARLLVGRPTWPNHEPIAGAVGLATETYRYFDVREQALRFDALVDAIAAARPGDVVLLHGCCHNPSGADPSLAQWRMLAEAMRDRRLIPLIDLAYQGMGRGLDEDVEGVRHVVATVEEAVVAVSCSKNFGLYRERTGALFVTAATAGAAEIAQGRLAELARLSYSMPPDHGAAIVRAILDNPALRALWRQELEEMRRRVDGLRGEIAAGAAAIGGDLSAVRNGAGMFALFDLDAEAIAALRRDHGIYMAANGRANLAGLRASDIPRFVEALLAARSDLPRRRGARLRQPASNSVR